MRKPILSIVKFAVVFSLIVTVPPILYSLYFVVDKLYDFNGNCPTILAGSYPCTKKEFFIAEVSNTFFVGGLFVTSVYWVAILVCLFFGYIASKAIVKYVKEG
jgi:hypothetical protein